MFDYGSGPKFDFDAGSLPTPAGSQLPGDPYADLNVLKKPSVYERLMEGTLDAMDPAQSAGAQGTPGGMTPQERQNGLSLSRGGGGGLAKMAMTMMGVPGFAHGGFRQHGMPAMVGEEGPEMLYPGQGGDMVVPMGGTSRGMAPPAMPPPPMMQPPPPMVSPGPRPYTPPPGPPPPPMMGMPPRVAGPGGVMPPMERDIAPWEQSAPPMMQPPPPQAAAPPPPPVQPQNAGPPRFSQAQQQYMQVMQQAPPKPKLYEKILSAASMFPIARPAAAFNPYPQRVQEWKANREGARAGLDLEQEALEQQRRDRTAEASIEASKAAAEASRARATRAAAPPAARVTTPSPPANEQAYWTRKLDDPDPAVREQAQNRLNELNAKTPERPPAPESRTPDQKNYEQYKKDGGKLTFDEWQTRDANRRRPTVSPATTDTITRRGNQDKVKTSAAKYLKEANGDHTTAAAAARAKEPEESLMDVLAALKAPAGSGTKYKMSDKLAEFTGTKTPGAATATPSPAAKPAAAPATAGTIHIRVKAGPKAGKTGTVLAADFDPNLMEKIP